MSDVIESIDSVEVTDATEDVGTDNPDSGAGEELSEEAGGQPSTEGGEVNTPSYQPNFQYKVYDDVKEFPEWTRPLVRDEVTEKNLRDLFTKAEGLDAIKDRYGRTKDELDQIREASQRYENFLKTSHHWAKNDFGTFLEMHEIPREQVLRYAQEVLSHDDPERKAAYEARRQDVQERFEAQTKAEQLEQLYKQERTERFNTEMRWALNQPHIKEFAAKYDEVNGRGAFVNEIADYGSARYARGTTVPPMESVQAVYDKLSRFIRPSEQVHQAGATAAPQQRPHTIPNMGSGRGHSPAKQRPRNLDELKKHIAEQIKHMPG